MTKVFILTLLLAVCSFGQLLQFDDLQKMQMNDVDDVNNLLIGKGWNLHKTTQPDAASYGDITWFNTATDTSNEISFFKYYYSPGKYSRVAYIFQNRKTYDIFINRIKRLSLKKLGARTGDNMIVTDYASDKYVVSVSVFNDTENNSTFYTFLYFDKRDFDRIGKSKN